MKIKLKFGSLKKWLIFIMVACVLVLGGLIITSPMLDNSDPITSGEWSIGTHDPIPIPESQVTGGIGMSDAKSEYVTELDKLDKTIEEVKQKAIEVKEDVMAKIEDSKEDGKKVATGGGIGFGTLVALYVGYRFIFK